MINGKFFQILISALAALILVMTVGCGEKRRKSATGGSPPDDPPRCTENCDDNDNNNKVYIKGWSSELSFNKKAYQDFLKDAGICNPPGWYEVGRRCKHWDDRAWISVEVKKTSIPTPARVVFTIYNRYYNEYRKHSYSGTIHGLEEQSGIYHVDIQ